MNMINEDRYKNHRFLGMKFQTYDEKGEIWVDDEFDIKCLEYLYISFEQFIPEKTGYYFFVNIRYEKPKNKEQDIVLKRFVDHKVMMGDVTDILNIHHGNCFKTADVCRMDSRVTEELEEYYNRYLK